MGIKRSESKLKISVDYDIYVKYMLLDGMVGRAAPLGSHFSLYSYYSHSLPRELVGGVAVWRKAAKFRPQSR